MHSFAMFHRMLWISQRARANTQTHAHAQSSKWWNTTSKSDKWSRRMGKHYYRGHRGLFRVHLFNYFCRIVFLGCWKEETVSITILVGKTQISFHLFFDLFATVVPTKFSCSGIHVSIATHCDVTACLWLLQEVGRHET